VTSQADTSIHRTLPPPHTPLTVHSIARPFLSQVVAEDTAFASDYEITVIRRAPPSSCFLTAVEFSPCCVDPSDVPHAPTVTTVPPCCDVYAPDQDPRRRRFNITVPSIYQSVRCALALPPSRWVGEKGL